MRILFLGRKAGNGLSRIRAIERLGHEVVAISPNPPKYPFANGFFSKFHSSTGGVYCEKSVRNTILAELDALLKSGPKPDLVWVNCGRYVGPALIEELKRKVGPVIAFNQDDPYNPNHKEYSLFRKAIPHYDVVVVVREPNVQEAKSFGAKKVLREFMVADEVIHSPRPLTDADWEKWGADVAFIGTWRPERGPFILKLVECGVPVSIYGQRWDKDPAWSRIQPYWKGPGLSNKDDYAKAIQCAKISLGLLAKDNRDGHTTRTMEIPLLGGLLCGERTAEHLSLYEDGVEAVFWSDPQECADVCNRLLADEELRLSIVRAGQARCLRNGHLNSAMCGRVIAAATA